MDIPSRSKFLDGIPMPQRHGMPLLRSKFGSTDTLNFPLAMQKPASLKNFKSKVIYETRINH